MEFKFDIKEVVSRSFDVINLPSKGEFYEDKNSSLKIRYLSGVEEKVLSSYFLNETGEALYIVLENLILDKIDIEKLILPDLQGIMIFLYSTAFGDKISFQVKCPHCGHEEEAPVYLSQLNFKKTDSQVVGGKFVQFLPFSSDYADISKELVEYDGNRYVELIYKPITFGEHIKLKKSGVDIQKNSINKVVYSLESVGKNDNKEDIQKFVKSLNLNKFKQIKDFVAKNELGVEDKFYHNCAMCSAENEYALHLGHDFLKLPDKHRQNVLEECFLLSHYGKGGMSFDNAMELPTYERRWAINRIQEEMQKQKEAEEKAYNAAKSGSRSPNVSRAPRRR